MAQDLQRIMNGIGHEKPSRRRCCAPRVFRIGIWQLIIGGVMLTSCASLTTMLVMSKYNFFEDVEEMKQVSPRPSLYHRELGLAMPPTTHGVHACIVASSSELRQLVAVISSVVAHASQKIFFHVFTLPGSEQRVKEWIKVSKLEESLPIQVHSSSSVVHRILSALNMDSDPDSPISRARLFSMMPFYLPEFLSAEMGRLIFLSTDTIVKGDLVELLDLQLHGHAIASVEDCSQRGSDIIDFGKVANLGFTLPVSEQSCVLDLGIIVLDVMTWREQRFTEQIEGWISASFQISWNGSQTDSRSEPWLLPALLAMAGRGFERLGPEWSCPGLSREIMSLSDVQELEALGFTSDDLKQIGVQVVHEATGLRKPHVAICSAWAKLLRFNGGPQPWDTQIIHVSPKSDRGSTNVSSMCAAPQYPPPPSDAKWVNHTAFVACSQLWSWYAHIEVLRSSPPKARRDKQLPQIKPFAVPPHFSKTQFRRPKEAPALSKLTSAIAALGKEGLAKGHGKGHGKEETKWASDTMKTASTAAAGDMARGFQHKLEGNGGFNASLFSDSKTRQNTKQNSSDEEHPNGWHKALPLGVPQFESPFDPHHGKDHHKGHGKPKGAGKGFGKDHEHDHGRQKGEGHAFGNDHEHDQGKAKAKGKGKSKHADKGPWWPHQPQGNVDKGFQGTRQRPVQPPGKFMHKPVHEPPHHPAHSDV